MMNRLYVGLFTLFITIFILNGCGGGGSSGSLDSDSNANISDIVSYKGLQFYYEPMSFSSYKLDQLSDSDFNALTDAQKLQVANKLLNTLFFGYDLQTLNSKIEDGNFISALQNGLMEQRVDTGWLESYILDAEVFGQYTYNEPQAITILTRFYAMNDLDKYYINNWISYILTQTIMFSPAYELESSHTPNIANVYNRVVTMLNNGAGMRYITYVHTSSEDNWRRFRSPEDNGREMLEIYLLDTQDSHVPLAAKALQNWKLNTDSDTLEVGLNKNTTPISLFNTTIYNGDDFYRELVKSDQFTYGVTKRLVDFFFPSCSETDKVKITQTIVSSKPETWQDITLQIVFSKEYLLKNSRAQSAEETFFSLAKKMNFRNKISTFYTFKYYLDSMNQATMKYKLGKLDPVPLDSLSFANYHKYIRENILLNYAHEDESNRSHWRYDGWLESFIDYSNFEYNEDKPIESLTNFINYLFKVVIAREPTTKEMELFKSHILTTEDGEVTLKHEFDFCYINDDAEYEKEKRDNYKRNIAILILDYLSRLDQTYTQTEVK